MPEVTPAQTFFKCRGCPRVFDRVTDVCQECQLCRRCHLTALGNPQPHEFNDPRFVSADVTDAMKALEE